MHYLSKVFLPLLLLGYLSYETYSKLTDTSLCTATGCALAGELVRFDSIYLNYAGMVGMIVLAILGFLSLKHKLASNLFFITLYGAIAFEATIITYQFIANPEPCSFCLTIFSSLLLIALLSNTKEFLKIMSVVGAIFVGLHTLTITKNRPSVTVNGTYLIESKSCSHCKKVKAYLKDSRIDYKTISALDTNARGFLKFVDINSIPVLIIKSNDNIKILKGDTNIIGYFTKDEPPVDLTASTSTSSSLDLGNGFLSEGSGDEGCSLSIVETTPSCSGDVDEK